MAAATPVLVWLALYGMSHSNPTANRFTYTQTTAEQLFSGLFVVGMTGAMFTAFAAYFCFSFESSKYEDFTWDENGFGRNLIWLLEAIKKPLEALHPYQHIELGLLADELLVERAKLVVQVEEDIEARIGDSYRKPNWKYDSDWDKAKKSYDALFYMFERFGLADKETYSSAFARAEAQLKKAS